MIYTNYYKNYNDMISRISRIDSSSNYMSVQNKTYNNTYNHENILKRKSSDFVNNISKYSEYDKSSKEFNKEFIEKFSKLKESAEKLKSYSSNSVFFKRYNDGEYDKASSERNDVRVKPPSRSYFKEKEKAVNDDNSKIYSAVEKFASSYNEAVSFLNNNKDKSNEISNLAQSYTSIVKYNKSTLSGIGINVDANGKLTIDKDKLMNAIKENKDIVRNTLGDSTSGVANKIYNKTSVSMLQSKELYPASKLKNDYINNTYFYNPSNSSILQANQMYSSGMFLDLLL